MTAVVGAAASVLHSASSADFSARRFPPNIASHVSFQSTPFSFLCSSGFPALRKSGRRRTRRVVEVREGSSFVSLVSKELANNGNEEFGGRQSASGRNARFTRASMQEESFRSRSSILAKNEGKLPWVLHTQQARRVKASSMYHSRGSKFSKSADTPESYNRNERHHKQAFPKKIRSSPDGQRYHSSSVGKKYPKAPLLTENQQSRLHNKVTIFEGITEPRSSDYNDAHQCSLPVDVDDGFSNIKEQDANLNMEILDHRHNFQKGNLFMLKLEEELSILRTAEGSHDLTRGGEEARRKEAPFGRTEGKEVQRKGTITNVLDGQNAHDIIQPNSRERSSGNKLQKPTVSANWHKHEIPNLPFEFQFSYSETPQKPILCYRGHPFSPFGPSSMKRPWIGDRPNNPSKKKPRVFDSFHPPPRDLKGVKHVQDPGPYPVGQGPKAAKSKEEIMGEPLTKEEIVYLVEKCQRETRQLNLGRDGLTHNMLDVIHSHWKRRRVCKIKCKGVPTVDMDNVKFHIEDKTGGKIIYQAGGVLYMFRGRNYNYKDHPHIPLMLWKPATPIYPKLIQEPPEGLTTEEAYKLRKLGRKVEPICKLAKNGVYTTLVDDVRAAFKVDELVRVDCQGLNPSDYKKIGAKLRDLVPCVLLSFDKEHILMWKGKEETTVKGTSMRQAPKSEATEDNTCDGAEHSALKIDKGAEKVFKPPPTAQDPCEVEEASGLLASPYPLAIEREDNKGQVHALSTSVGLPTSKEQVDEENCSQYVVDIDALWGHAFQSGMAIELPEGDMDSDLIVRKADELALSAPLAPKYTIRLMYKFQMKRDPDYIPNDEMRIHFGRVVTQRPKKEVKRRFQLPTVGVPGMGGLPVDEVAKLLVRK